ncbi:hypothetical protein PV326_008627 [Microctonus aethiopoides]|nr:hypothetical protein PV326_008627 [Microctonus aethiopoides]
MAPIQVLFVTLFIIQGFIGLDGTTLKVKLLHVLFRHGDKVPHKEYQNYPNDPYRNHTYHPVDNGDLTNEGKLREYTIGIMLREKYGEFLGPYYWPSLIFARSTDIPRTQMSLQLVLAGLFPPSEEQMWNPSLQWLPVSTISVPNAQDNLLFPNECPQYIKVYKEFLMRDSTKKIIAKYSDTMKYISKHSGKLVETTSAVTYLYNLFKEQKAQNLTLPEWTKKVYPNPMEEIIKLDFNLRSYTKHLKRLNGGILLREVTENMKALRDGILEPSNRKAFLYAAHEFNVVAMSRALGLENPVIPSYGSAIIFETLQDEKKRLYVKIVLWTGVTEQLINQRIPGCNELCPLEQFLKILSDVIPNVEEVNQCHDELIHIYNHHGRKTKVFQCEMSKNMGTSFNTANSLFVKFMSFISLIKFYSLTFN